MYNCFLSKIQIIAFKVYRIVIFIRISFVGVKFPNQTMDLGLHTESSHDRGENGAPKGLLAQL